MFCGKCGIENRDDLKFCTKCGSELARQTPVPRKTDSSTLSDQETVVAPEADEDTFSKGSLFANRYEILLVNIDNILAVINKKLADEKRKAEEARASEERRKVEKLVTQDFFPLDNIVVINTT